MPEYRVCEVWRTVKENRVSLDYNLKCIPNLVLCTLNCFSCSLNIDNSLSFYKAFHNKRFEKLNSHFLRKTALVHLKFRAYNDNRTTRIVNTLTEKVLRKRPCLPLSISESDLSGRLLGPVTGLPLLPLSMRASTDSCSILFSFLMMISGALSSRSFLNGCFC